MCEPLSGDMGTRSSWQCACCPLVWVLGGVGAAGPAATSLSSQEMLGHDVPHHPLHTAQGQLVRDLQEVPPRLGSTVVADF